MWIRGRDKLTYVSGRASAETTAAREDLTGHIRRIAQGTAMIDTTILKETAAQLPRNSELRELLISLPDKADIGFLLTQVRTWRTLARMEDMNCDMNG